MSHDRKPNPVLATLGRLLESALNRALTLDLQTRTRLAGLEGRRIGIELRGINLAFSISVQNGHLHVGPHWEHASDLNLRAAPASLLAFALRRDGGSVPPGKVEISGDAELARQLEKLLRDFRPDIEEAFATTFGDVLGVPIARAFSAAFQYTRVSAQALTQNTAEFLREESRDLIAPAEMEQFLDDIDHLRERVDRFDARMQRTLQRVRGDVA